MLPFAASGESIDALVVERQRQFSERVTQQEAEAEARADRRRKQLSAPVRGKALCLREREYCKKQIKELEKSKWLAAVQSCDEAEVKCEEILVDVLESLHAKKEQRELEELREQYQEKQGK